MSVRDLPHSKIVWSGGGADIFHAITPAYQATKVGYVRIALDLCHATVDLNVAVAYQTSDDGVSWTPSTGTAISSGLYLAQDNFTVDSTFVDMTTVTDGVMLIRFGVIASSDNSNTAYQLGTVSMKVDIKPH